MRKLIQKSSFLLLAVSLIFALAGCGSPKSDTQKQDDTGNMSNMDHSKMNMGDSNTKK